MTKNENIIWFFPIISLMVIFFMIGKCTPKINKKYKITKIEKGNIDNFIETNGTVEGKDVIKIGTDTDLIVEKIYFQKGEKVKKGDILIKFSDYKEKEINLKLDDLKKDISVKMSELRYLREEYRQGGEVSEKIQKLMGEIKILNDEINKISKEKYLIKRNIMSPVNAYIIDIDVGNKAAITLVEENNYKIKTDSLKVKDVKIDNGTEVEIIKKLDKVSYKYLSENKILKGKIFKINDMGVENFKNFEILINQNEKNDFKLGEKVKIKIIISRKSNIMSVPITAVKNKENKKYIYLIDKNNKIIEKEIKTGINNGEKVEIIEKNLKEKMEIIEILDDEIKNNIIVERLSIADEKNEINKKIEKLEKENQKNQNEIEKNEIELIRLKRKI